MADVGEDMDDLLAGEGSKDESPELESVVELDSLGVSSRRWMGRRRWLKTLPITSSVGRRGVCIRGVLIVVLLVVTAAVFLAIGLVVGHSLGSRGSGSMSGGVTPPSATLTPCPSPSPPATVQYNWGDTVRDGLGKKVEVAGLFKEGIVADDISSYLE